MDLPSFSAERPPRPIRLLFIHHSCGGQLLCDPGPEKEIARCIYVSHPNGGGLRKRLESEGYEVHEASYGSDVGDETDLFDWLPKFRDKMDKVKRIDQNDTLLPEGETNEVVLFKSCYPNSRFVGEGTPPGSARGPELTLANAKAAFSELRSVFDKHPETLFVYVTAPPNAPKEDGEPGWKSIAKRALGKRTAADRLAEQARIARKFNDWVKGDAGWLAGYSKKNVVVFDYFDVLTDRGASNLSRYPNEDGYDSHPTSEGNRKAAAELVPLLNRAVRRAGLVP
jgi:hypothetical protein